MGHSDRLADVAKPPIRAQHQAVLAHGDAVDLPVNVLDVLQQVVEDLVRLPVAPCAESRRTAYWPPRLAAETAPQPASGQVPQSHLQLLQHQHLRRTVGWPRVLREQRGPVPQVDFAASTPSRPSSTLSLVSLRCSVRRGVVWLA